MKQLIFLLVLLCALGLLALSAGTPTVRADSTDNGNALPAILSASSTMEEMAAFDAAGPAPESQVVPFNEKPGPLSGGDAAAAPRMLPGTAGGEPGPGPISGAPALVTNFIGVLDDGTRIPPDTMGAVGPNHIVEFLNTGFTVFDRTGVVVSAQITLQAFWAVLGTLPGQPASWPYDPKILYDQYVGRWVVTADGNPNARDGTNASWVLVGISQSSDPTLGWNLFAINPDATATTWSDYPGLGIDGANVYVTNNMYTIATPPVFSVAKFWVISKAAMMAGNIVGQFSTFTDTIGTGTWQPCHSFDASAGGNNYIVTENWVDAASRMRRFLRIQQFAGVGAAAVINTFGGNNWLEVNQYNMNVLDAPQMNCTTLINTNDSRLLNAVMRNGKIWTTHEVGIGSGITDIAPPSRPEVAWYECSPAAFAAFPGGVPIQQGRVSSPLSDDPMYYYYPSIAVNRDECAALGFSGSSAVSYVSAYYTMRKPTDAAGYMDTVGLLKAGEAPYWKDWTTGRNRWGDFSATMVDPVDDLTFWTVQEYASNGRVTVPCVQDDGEWGTWWGSFECECAKWSQPPDTSENGIDIRCDRNDGMPRTLADDYLCTKTGPITNVTIWGSWKYDDIGVIDKFHLSIHDDIPADPNGSIPYSMPGNLLWSQDFTNYTPTLYASLTEPEWWWDPVTGQLIQWCDFQIWQYDISIDPDDAFVQQGEPNAPTIYWLDLYVELDPQFENTEFGWKTSSEHWNDDAVWSDIDGGGFWNELRYIWPHPLEPNSIDMAFEIATGEEEPETDEFLKFQQLPLNGPDYFGHDELSTAYMMYDPTPAPIGYEGCYMADDFADLEHSPVIKLKWWGSYLENIDTERVQQFLIAFEKDIPADDALQIPSHPGQVLYSEIVNLNSAAPPLNPGEFSEINVGTGGPPCNEALWEYEALLMNPFPQDPNTVYWLKIVALYDEGPAIQALIAAIAGAGYDLCTFLNLTYQEQMQIYDVLALTRWGWHNRDYTIMDPYASTPPAVVPGEHLAGTVFDPCSGADLQVWHFQDDAVSGEVFIDPSNNPFPEYPESPYVEQGQSYPDEWRDENYILFSPLCTGTGYVDGPGPSAEHPEGIAEFSKDLAFEIYTNDDCFPSTDPGYANWVLAGKHSCWCDRYNCKGDADNLFTGTNADGKRKWVTLPDLNILSSGWGKKESVMPNALAYCGDADRLFTGTNANGKRKWVTLPDLTILSAHWGKKESVMPPGPPCAGW